jgi:hypothetical protein
MESHELLREVLQKHSAKQLAAELGLSLSMVYKWSEAPDSEAGSGAANPLDRIETLIKATNDQRIVHWLCERSGGFFIQNPKTTHRTPEFLIPATNQILQEFADMLNVIATAAGDNSITRKEATEIRARWNELKSVTETFVHCCEQGNFDVLRQNLVKTAAAAK